MLNFVLLVTLLIPPLGRPSGPTKEMLREWFRMNDSAPPAEWYPHGDPWRNLTTEEVLEAHGEGL
jgi:hypothetical protein